MNKDYDFAGWATRNDLKCSDGRTIKRDAFKHCDGTIVPLVWNHQHNNVENVLGHALLENRDEGVYAYCYLNNTGKGNEAKEMVKHGDITQLSIYANQLRSHGNNVVHGTIKELSLVLAGANPGAFIDTVLIHNDEGDEEAVIYTGSFLSHSDETYKKGDGMETDERTVQDIVDSMTEEQRTVMYALIGQALEENEDNKGDEKMKHNLFENDNNQDTLMHAEAMGVILADAKRYGSLKESFLAHAGNYGIDNIEYLFPEAKTINQTPDFIQRDMGWVAKVMHSVHHTPFSRIKSVHANITEEDARAKGYIKGKLKKEEVFSLLKRTTTPTTIYKKQKLDRDDVIDITDFDVVSWLKTEMRMMLDEEIARAVLTGDGRLASSDDKINEQNIRPIWTDADLYTIKSKVEIAAGTSDDDKALAFIKAIIKSRKQYKGSGNPTLFTTEDMLTDCLLLEDKIGHKLYKTVTELATALRVKEIITVPTMENLTRTDTNGVALELGGIVVNLVDYNIGADKGGAVNMFDDFDIDYNQQKYLIETRCSGALIKPFSAIAVEFATV